jgi:hypothetical protein
MFLGKFKGILCNLNTFFFCSYFKVFYHTWNVLREKEEEKLSSFSTLYVFVFFRVACEFTCINVPGVQAGCILLPCFVWLWQDLHRYVYIL